MKTLPDVIAERRQAPKEVSDLAGKLEGLSPADRQRAFEDLIVFGAFYLYERTDGTVELLDPVRLRVGAQQPVALLPRDLIP